MSLCDRLAEFADGELQPHEADAMRVHLAFCRACQRDLVELNQLDARLSTLLTPQQQDELVTKVRMGAVKFEDPK